MSDDSSDQAAGGAGATINQVRDLLFGAEAKAQREEVTNLRKHVDKQLSRIEATLSERLDKLGETIQGELRTLRTALDQEVGERTSAVEGTRDLITATGSSLAELAGVTSQETGAIRSQLQQTTEEITEQLRTAEAGLEARKTDRVALAGLLQTMAAQVAPELATPAPEAEPAPPAESSGRRSRKS